MARVKSELRQRLNIRYIRWAVASFLIGGIPPLKRKYSFYLNTIHPEKVASGFIEDLRYDLVTGFTPKEIEFIRDCCWQFDTLTGRWRAGVAIPIRQMTVTIASTEILGHVSRVFLPPYDAVVMYNVAQANWNFAKAKILKELPAIAGRAHLLPRTDNYYHMLFHDLVPLVDYLERHHPRGMPLTLVLQPSTLHSFALGCALLVQAYPGLKVLSLPNDHKVEADEALWLSFDAGNAEWTFADAAPVYRLAEIYRAHYNVEPGGGRRIFFSRGASKIRRLINEDALWEIARAYGFERFEARADNHAEQVRMFSQADIVIGVHGAGLGNLLFCRPRTQVIEIFPENFTKSTYLWLSKRIGLDYDWLVGGPGNYDQAFALEEALLREKLHSKVIEPRAPVI